MEICLADNGKVIASSYLIMPHTADWARYVDSTSFPVELKAGTKYCVKIFEDEFARNMSYFDHYESYKSAGNGDSPYNYVNIAAVKMAPANN